MCTSATTRIRFAQRLINANGHADNQVIVGNLAPSDLLIEQMGRWLAAVASDTSQGRLAEKVVSKQARRRS